MSEAKDRVRNSRAVRIALVVLASIVIVVGVASAVATTSGGDLAAEVVAPHPAQGPGGPSPAPTYCSLDTATDPCPGILPISFVKAPTWKALESVKEKIFVDIAEHSRATDCDKPPCKPQDVSVHVNEKARHIQFEKIPDTSAVIAGRMRFPRNGRPDKRYKTGDDLGHVEDTKMIYVVVHSLNSVPGVVPHPTATEEPIARWTMVKVTHSFCCGINKSAKLTGRTGIIWRCIKEHPGSKDPDANFQTCLGDAQTRKIAIEMGTTQHEVLRARDCAQDPSNCTQPRKPSIGGMKIFSTGEISAMQRELTLHSDALVDPYWFSCSLGCCTAM